MNLEINEMTTRVQVDDTARAPGDAEAIAELVDEVAYMAVGAPVEPDLDPAIVEATDPTAWRTRFEDSGAGVATDDRGDTVTMRPDGTVETKLADDQGS